jgi:UDP-N-acetylmuramyl pentapeptide phosphotransferase/UDP-N-acetylglucosamine-1-phosphate transferase
MVGLVGGAIIAAAAAALSGLLIVAMRPLLQRYALAQPNARSSHTVPTAQGGGIAVIAATLVTACAALQVWLGSALPPPLPLVLAAALLIAAVGAADDVRGIPVVVRLLLQFLAVTLVIYALPRETRVVAFMPWWLERALLLVGGVWFVNLVNFMDGLDWMTVAEMVPITAALAFAGAIGALPPAELAVALALAGAMIGFAFFNRPVATLFLGDVGSLPIALLVGWLLLGLAAERHLVAAVVMPLYYLADATLTLIWRLARGEPIWKAHRSHFYQIATDRGFSVIEVVGLVFAANLVLCALAIVTVTAPGLLSDLAALFGGGAIVAALLAAFARGKT